jgi:hypothetical protein
MGPGWLLSAPRKKIAQREKNLLTLPALGASVPPLPRATQPTNQPTNTTMNDSFELLNDLTNAISDLGIISDDGDRDETDARAWAAINTLREELQNALHA